METKRENLLHDFLSNYYVLKKYFSYYTELTKNEYRKVRDEFPIIGDSLKCYYFHSVLLLCNFIKGNQHLYLGKIIKVISNRTMKENLEKILKYLENSDETKNLFNLRDKLIAHRDSNWFNYSTDFSDQSFNSYLSLIETIIEGSLGIKLDNSYNKLDEDSEKLLSFLKTRN